MNLTKNEILNIYFQTLGCAKNEVDSNDLISLLSSIRLFSESKSFSFDFVKNPSHADIIILNTCGFIESAKEESINTFFELDEYKNSGKCKILIMTGCLAQRYSKSLKTELKEADLIIPIKNYSNFPSIIAKSISKKFNTDNLIIKKVASKHTQNNSSSVYVKIAEGCDNHCSYCTIPLIRGNFKSFTFDKIYSDVESAVLSGGKEIVLIAQDTLNWKDDYSNNFEYLLNELASEFNNIWFRILYLHPKRVSDSLLDVFSKHDNIVKYFDIPFQHASDKLLKSMNRVTTKNQNIEILNKIKNRFPDSVIRSTFIIGHPLETKEDFEELIEFIEDNKFQRAGFFSYSHEEETKDFEYDDLPDEIKIERLNEISIIQDEISVNWTSSLIGLKSIAIVEEEIKPEIIDSSYKYLYYGRTFREAPDDDPYVYIESEKKIELNSFVNIKIYDSIAYNPIALVD